MTMRKKAIYYFTVFLLLFAFCAALCSCGSGGSVSSESAPSSQEKEPDENQLMLQSVFSYVMPEAEVRAEKVGDYYEVTIKTGNLDFSEIPEEEEAAEIAERLLAAYDDIPIDDINVCAQIVDAGDIILFNSRNGEMKYDYYLEATENRPTISLEEYKKIYNGMKYAEVIEVIGGTGKVLSSIDIGDPAYKTEVISWDGEGMVGANATIEFQGGKVCAMAQFGLQ